MRFDLEGHALIGPDWRAEWRGDGTSVFRFDFGDLGLDLNGVAFGDLGEADFVADEARFHDYMDVDGKWVESAARVGFDGPPTVTRKTEWFQNRAMFAVEVKPPRDLTKRSMAVDSLFLRGNWRHVTIGEAASGDAVSVAPVVSRMTLDGTGDVVVESDEHWLFCVLSDGESSLEIGVGDDLWRWSMAAKLGLKSRFRLERREGGLALNREVLTMPENVAAPRRAWRFKWYFSWMRDKRLASPSQTPASEDEATPLAVPNKRFNCESGRFLFPTKGWKAGTLARVGDETSEFPCLQAPQVLRHLRNWVRSIAENPPGSLISLENVTPCHCDAASHLARVKRRRLPHWNVHTLSDFHFWANRKLRKKGSALRIQATDDLLNTLPSLKGMSDYETGLDSDASQGQTD